MWRATVFLLLSSYAVAQTAVPMVDPDEAAQHLTKHVTPKYSGLAQMARIQGNVIFEVRIDVSGLPNNILVIRGHPMLIEPAMTAVRQWVYRPFEISGKTSEVRTFVAVQVGDPYPRRDLADRADVFTLMGKAYLSTGDLATAEQYLNRAAELLRSLKDDESWAREEWLAVSGRLDMAQKKYDEAERYLKQSLELAQRRVPQSSTVAEGQGWLAQLYTVENKYDLARTYGDQEIQTCQKAIKASGRDLRVKQELSAEIAYRSWMLALLALQQNDHTEAAKRCHSVLDYKEYLGTSLSRSGSCNLPEGTESTGKIEVARFAHAANRRHLRQTVLPSLHRNSHRA